MGSHPSHVLAWKPEHCNHSFDAFFLALSRLFSRYLRPCFSLLFSGPRKKYVYRYRRRLNYSTKPPARIIRCRGTQRSDVGPPLILLSVRGHQKGGVTPLRYKPKGAAGNFSLFVLGRLYMCFFLFIYEFIVLFLRHSLNHRASHKRRYKCTFFGVAHRVVLQHPEQAGDRVPRRKNREPVFPASSKPAHRKQLA